MTTGAPSRGKRDDEPSGCLVRSCEELSGVGPLRHEAARHLRGCGCSNVDDTVLVLSELVTNAVIHAGGADRLTIDCDNDSRTIRVEVHDRIVRLSSRRVTSNATSGRGLSIVEFLSTAWGVNGDADGKEVWATLPVDRRET